MTTGLRLKHVAKVDAGQSPPSPDVVPFDGEGMPFLQGNAEFGGQYPTAVHRCDSAPRIADAGALLVSVRAPVGAVNTADQRYGIGRGLAAVSPRAIHARYAYWLLLSAAGWLNSIATGSTFTAISGGDIGDVSVPVTNEREQRVIADYLDRETAQIDAFIAKTEELIALLTERRAAAAQFEVEHHVGVGSQLRYRFREMDARAGGRWAELPLLSVSIHHGVVPREDETEAPGEGNDLSHYKMAWPGDVVLNRMRAFQGGLGVAPCAGLVSPDYAVLRPSTDVNADWLAFVMRTPRFVGEMVMRLRGIGSTDSGAVRTPRIGVADLGSILVDVPSPEVQRAELREVQGAVARIETAIAVAQRSVELARERRAALISAAVTGKIDVRVAG